ncbi:hypothetical protein Lal_00038589 [Lupinus albus]|nr:hypothetical protein Lal_00038589 [Lupinus albus]
MDSKGDKIQVLVRKDEFNQWSQCLLENNTYVMHNFNVMKNDLQYKACDHREFHDIPELEYDFKKFIDILSENFRSDLLIGNYPPIVSNSWCGSKLLIDEEITNIQKYKDRYKLDIKVNHEHSCGRFVFWDSECSDINGIYASELKNQMLAEGEDDPKAFPLVLNELLARTMVLRVKVQPSYNQSSMIRLSEDPNLIKKVRDQIGVFESVSITTDHDQEQFQVVTPAKRLSTEFDLDLLQSPVYNSTQLSSSKMTKHMKRE